MRNERTVPRVSEPHPKRGELPGDTATESVQIRANAAATFLEQPDLPGLPTPAENVPGTPRTAERTDSGDACSREVKRVVRPVSVEEWMSSLNRNRKTVASQKVVKLIFSGGC